MFGAFQMTGLSKWRKRTQEYWASWQFEAVLRPQGCSMACISCGKVRSSEFYRSLFRRSAIYKYQCQESCYSASSSLCRDLGGCHDPTV